MRAQALKPSVRLLVLLFALGMIFLLIGGPAEAEAPVATVEYVVDAGDTPWGIARAHSGLDVDTRGVVAAIQELNGLTGGMIHPGQVLHVPTG